MFGYACGIGQFLMHVLRPGLCNPGARLIPPSKKPPKSTNNTNTLFNDPTQNKILGFARMRQLRVRNDSCTILPAFSRFRTDCYDHYTTDNEDTEPYGAAVIQYAFILYYTTRPIKPPPRPHLCNKEMSIF